jgi:hypothetical protein
MLWKNLHPQSRSETTNRQILQHGISGATNLLPSSTTRQILPLPLPSVVHLRATYSLLGGNCTELGMNNHGNDEP